MPFYRKEVKSEDMDKDIANQEKETSLQLRTGSDQSDSQQLTWDWDRVNDLETIDIEDSLALLYPKQELYERSELDSSSNASEAEKEIDHCLRPQVLSKCEALIEPVLNPGINMGSRPGVIVAAASSSSYIGDISINDDFLEVIVEDLDESNGVFSTREKKPLILSMTATQSTSEELVSSTSEAHQKFEIVAYMERCPDIHSLSKSSHSRTHRELISAGHGPQCERNDDKELNGNSFLYESLTVPQVADEEGGGDGEDDDSSGIILKDETDSAEEESDHDEVTDSASETEGGIGVPEYKRKKPIITITDQNYPRLVINFREEDKSGREIKRNSRKGSGKVGNNNSIKGHPTYIPIQHWVESVQRHNKRKRTESESLEEMP